MKSILAAVKAIAWWGVFLPIAILAVAACGGSEAAENDSDAAEATEATVELALPTEMPRPTPTLIPAPTATPRIVYIEVTPIPISPTEEPPEHTPDPEGGIEGSTDAQGPDTITVGPSLTPTPPPTPKYRTATRSAQDTNYKGLSFSSGPSMDNDILTFSVVMDGQGNEPSQIQLYHSLRQQDIDGISSCTTDHPIAFVEPGSAAGVTTFQWEFCGSSGAQPVIYVDDIPWVSPSTWSYELRKRRRIFDPYLYDWSVNVNLQGERVQELKYENGAGYILVIFSGETILTKVWIDD